MNFRNRYNHASPSSPSGGVSLTAQQYLKDCDINTILRRYRITGQLPVNPVPASYGDFSSITSFEDVYNRVHAADEMFSSMPSDVRDRFGNSPRAFFDFVLDPSNESECVKLGLRVSRDTRPSEYDLLSRIADGVTRKGEPLSAEAK